MFQSHINIYNAAGIYFCKWGACTIPRNTLQHAATHCSTLPTHCQHTANTLQHTATHCNTLQYTAAHGNTHIYAHQKTAAHCKTLQRTAPPCNALQLHSWYNNKKSTHAPPKIPGDMPFLVISRLFPGCSVSCTYCSWIKATPRPYQNAALRSAYRLYICTRICTRKHIKFWDNNIELEIYPRERYIWS